MKLSIKSFTVPELFVDLPETASVASLKVRMNPFIPHEDVSSVFNSRIGQHGICIAMSYMFLISDSYLTFNLLTFVYFREQSWMPL